MLSLPDMPFQVLLVEDNAADAELAQETIVALSRLATVHLARTGDAALEFIRSGDIRPHLILLDLGLPGTSGHEVLRELKRGGSSRAIPVIVTSNSGEEADIRAAYDLGANSYVRKPSALDEYRAVMELIGLYWFSVVSPPPHLIG